MTKLFFGEEISTTRKCLGCSQVFPILAKDQQFYQRWEPAR